MVLFNTQFLYWFSHSAVHVINSSLPVIVTLIPTCIDQERPRERTVGLLTWEQYQDVNGDLRWDQ